MSASKLQSALFSLLLGSALLDSSVSQELGVDLCFCQPITVSFKLNFAFTCPDSNVAGPGINETACLVETRNNDDGATDITPTFVSEVQVLELNQRFQIVGQSVFTGTFFNGEEISYTSIVQREPEKIENLSNVPRGFQVTITGLNSEEVSLVQTWAIRYSNDCGIFPLLEVGEQIGWSQFTDLGVPGREFCPVAHPPTESALTSVPTMSPSNEPTSVGASSLLGPTTSAPTEAPVSGTGGPTTEAPVSGTGGPAGSSTAEPNASPVSSTGAPTTEAPVSATGIPVVSPVDTPVLSPESPPVDSPPGASPVNPPVGSPKVSTLSPTNPPVQVCYPLDEVTLSFNEFSAGDLTSSHGSFNLAASNCLYPMIFDTANPTGGDTDLVTPNNEKILIVSEDCDASNPDDRGEGGTITFTPDGSDGFDAVKFSTICFTDLYGGEIVGTNLDGEMFSQSLPNQEDAGYECIDIEFSDEHLTELTINLAESGGVHKLTYVMYECEEISCPELTGKAGKGKGGKAGKGKGGKAGKGKGSIPDEAMTESNSEKDGKGKGGKGGSGKAGSGKAGSGKASSGKASASGMSASGKSGKGSQGIRRRYLQDECAGKGKSGGKSGKSGGKSGGQSSGKSGGKSGTKVLEEGRTEDVEPESAGKGKGGKGGKGDSARVR